MKEVRNNVLLCLGSLAVMSVFLYLGFSGGWDFKLGLWGVISFGVAAFFAWEAYDKATVILRSKKEREQWNVAAQVELELPFAELETRFQKLAGSGEAVVEPDYLSWNTGAFADIRISKVDESDWLALFWLRSDWHYNDTQLTRICKKEKLELPPSFRKMRAHGLAVYQKGTLSLYPAPHLGAFEDAFMDNIFLRSHDEFDAWLKDYLDEG